MFFIGGWEKNEIENWVQEVAKRSGQQVDWGYIGGRANIIGLGDLDKIRHTIKEMLPTLNISINRYMETKYGPRLNDERINYTAQDVDYWAAKSPMLK